MLRIDRQLIDRILDDLPPREAIAGINQYIAPRNLRDPEFGLTRPDWNVRLYCIYLGEVGNGGHEQFFLNPSGDHAGRAMVALHEMGLDSLAEILSEACEVFPGGLVSTPQDERETVVAQLPSKAMSTWRRLDRRLYRRGDSDERTVLQYMRANRGQIPNRGQILCPETA